MGPFGNLGIGISALALTLASASASTFKYKHCLLLNLELVLYTIYSKQFIFRKVATSFTKGIAVIPRRKFFEISKRSTLHNPCQKIPVVKSVFNKIARMDSRPAFCWKEVSTKNFFLWINQNFSVRSNVNSLSKIAGCALGGCTLLKRCYTMNYFKMFFLES